ncbi:MAG: M28 family peptidase [Thermoplasmata archaeon]|nr:MAG: M28 family peptidase [Thermoplasmata archaeon]
MVFLRFLKGNIIIMISCFILTSSSFSSGFVQEEPQFAKPQSNGIQPSAENVHSEIDIISDWYRYLGTSGHKTAEDYIYSKFESFGLNTSLQEYTVNRIDGNARGANVLGLLEGTLEPKKWLVIGGHYDANIRATHGAYDNAAGAATVIELARYFVEYYQNQDGPEISTLFATWDAEEGGGAGSSYFLENLPPEIKIVAYINLDMYSLNYPIKNSIPGSSEEFFKLYLYASPIVDFSKYSDIDYNDSIIDNFTIFQDLLKDISYTQNGYPPEWVLVMDDTDGASDHKFFIRKSIPAVWFRGMNEYPKDEGDLNERNFKHTPVDTLETMELYAGGKSELLKGISTGLTISYQLALGVLNLSAAQGSSEPEPQEAEEGGIFSDMGPTGYLIAVVAVIIILGILYNLWVRNKRSKQNVQ